MSDDYLLIQKAFEKLAELERLFGDSIPNRAIREGIVINGEQILLENQVQGIFKPRQMQYGALSIKTTMSRGNAISIYNDQLNDDGYYHYSLESGDPRGVRNRLLWESYERKQPFIYFHAVAPAIYKALWPCFIDSIFPDVDHPFCRVLVGQGLTNDVNELMVYPNEIQTRYQVRESKIRLHQASFREAVLTAYHRRCAITGIKEERLIEAAHIIPDGLIGDKQSISNGIALSRIHHKAYDSQLIGIDPDFKIHICEKLKYSEKNDFIRDAFLKYDGKSLSLPTVTECVPDRHFLARKFEEFELRRSFD